MSMRVKISVVWRLSTTENISREVKRGGRRRGWWSPLVGQLSMSSERQLLYEQLLFWFLSCLCIFSLDVKHLSAAHNYCYSLGTEICWSLSSAGVKNRSHQLLCPSTSLGVSVKWAVRSLVARRGSMPTPQSRIDWLTGLGKTSLSWDLLHTVLVWTENPSQPLLHTSLSIKFIRIKHFLKRFFSFWSK